MTTATRLDAMPHVEWGVFIVEDGRLRRPDMVGPADELVLLAVVRPAPAAVTVELYRGEILRDRRVYHPTPADSEAVLAMRLGRSQSPDKSSRLRCRLLVNERSIGEHTVLLGAPAIDAQGRIAEAPAVATSDATRLAMVRLLEETWQPSAD